MAEALRYLLVVEAAGLAVWPLLARALPALPDRGFALAKGAGLFALALLDLWLAAAGALAELSPVARTAVALLLLAAASLALLASPRSPRATLVRRLAPRRRALLAFELIFLAAFAAGLLLRAADPGVAQTERPMDRMLLGALLEAPGWPIEDPWLAGEPLAYYTLGHAAIAAPARLAGVAADIAYNLGFALVFALLASGCAGVAWALTRPLFARPARGGALACALAGGGLAAIAGAPAVLDALERLPGLLAGRPVGAWWWRSSRTLVDAAAPGGPAELIHEAPAFTLLVGDLHAHWLALPLVVLACALAVALVRRPRRRAATLFAALLGGATLATNPWALPVVLALALAGAAASSGAGRGRRALGLALAVAGGGALVALPHLLLVTPGGRALVVNATTPSPIAPLVALWLPVLPGLALLLAAGPRRGLAAAVSGGMAAALAAPLAAALARPDGSGALLRLPAGLEACGLLAALAGRGVGGFALSFLLGAGSALALWRAMPAPRGTATGDGARRAALAVAAAGLLTLLGPELLYLRDGHATRLNTLFKAHSAAWPPLALAALAGAAGAVARGRRLAAGAAFAPLLAGLLFPAVALADRWRFASAPPTLDALAPLARSAPDVHAALLWVRDQVPTRARLLQAAAASYDAEALSASVHAAHPTLLGWPGHQAQWRGEAFARLAAGRAEAAAIVYEHPSAEAKQAVLERFAIDWIWLGPVERRLHRIDAASLAALEAVAEPRFARGGVTLYRRRGP